MKRVVIILSLLAMVFGFTAFQCASTEITSAKLYIQQDNYEKAKEALLKEVEKNPNSDEGYYLLGFITGEEGNFVEMVDYFEKSLAVSNKFQTEISRDRNYYWADNFNKGVGFFNRGTQATSEDSTKMYFDNSIERFQNAILIQPDSVDTYKNLTFAYINAGRTEEAIEPLKNLIEKEQSADSYAMIGEIYINQGQQLLSSHASTGNAQDSLNAVGKFEEAIKYLQQGRELHPNNGDILLYLSNAYINANKLDVAMDTFKEGVQQEPDNKYYRYNYGVLLLEAKDYENAEGQFKKAIELDPEYVNAVYNLAATYVRWGSDIRDEEVANETGTEEYKAKFEQALPHLEKYVNLNPEDAQIWELLGRVYANLGMEEESQQAFEKADQYR